MTLGESTPGHYISASNGHNLQAGCIGIPPAVVNAAVARIKRHTKLPVAVGFGVRTARQAREISASAEAVVVGSALVGAVKDSLDKKGKATARTVVAVAGLVAELAAGVRGPKRNVSK